MDLNDPELEFSDLVYAYQSWVMAIINDEKLDSKEKLLTDDIADDALFWSPTMRHLKSDFRLMAVDLPGHGDASPQIPL